MTARIFNSFKSFIKFLASKSFFSQDSVFPLVLIPSPFFPFIKNESLSTFLIDVSISNAFSPFLYFRESKRLSQPNFLCSASLFVKLFVIPIKKQSEQISNAKELAAMGVRTSDRLNGEEVKFWLEHEQAVQIKFDNDLPNIINAILHAPIEGRRKKAA